MRCVFLFIFLSLPLFAGTVQDSAGKQTISYLVTLGDQVQRVKLEYDGCTATAEYLTAKVTQNPETNALLVSNSRMVRVTFNFADLDTEHLAQSEHLLAVQTNHPIPQLNMDETIATLPAYSLIFVPVQSVKQGQEILGSWKEFHQRCSK